MGKLETGHWETFTHNSVNTVCPPASSVLGALLGLGAVGMNKAATHR